MKNISKSNLEDLDLTLEPGLSGQHPKEFFFHPMKSKQDEDTNMFPAARA